MKKMTCGLLVLACLMVGGCGGEPTNQTSGTQKSGSDTSNRVVAQKPIAGETERTFSLTVPFETVSLSQGMEKTIRLGINRGENFREEVGIKLSELPEGVSVDSQDIVIEPGSTGTSLVLKATTDAALGDFTIRVTGHTSSSGADYSTNLKLTVTQPVTEADKQPVTPAEKQSENQTENQR